jgi:hypothetical protein
MNKKLLSAFDGSIQRGKNEEVGSMDQFLVGRKTYYVNKTGRRTFALYKDGEVVALMEKTI